MADRHHKSYRSIGDVVDVLRERYPDVSPSSLRFLEREGLLTPQRTGGGHRVYSDQDLDRVSQIKEWQRQRLTLNDIRTRLASSATLDDPAMLSARFIDQVLARNHAGAFQTVVAADDLGVPLRTLFAEVLAPALREVGDQWEDGLLLVSQEKEVSELSRDLIAELTWRHAPPEPQRPPIVAACVKGERHDLGLRMVCGLLRAQGWALHYLGADVDAEFLLEAIHLHHPVAVLLSVSIDEHLPALQDTVARVRREITGLADVPVIVGGPVVRLHHDVLEHLEVYSIEDPNPARIVEEIEWLLQDEIEPSKAIHGTS